MPEDNYTALGLKPIDRKPHQWTVGKTFLVVLTSLIELGYTEASYLATAVGMDAKTYGVSKAFVLFSDLAAYRRMRYTRELCARKKGPGEPACVGYEVTLLPAGVGWARNGHEYYRYSDKPRDRRLAYLRSGYKPVGKCYCPALLLEGGRLNYAAHHRGYTGKCCNDAPLYRYVEFVGVCGAVLASQLCSIRLGALVYCGLVSSVPSCWWKAFAYYFVDIALSLCECHIRLIGVVRNYMYTGVEGCLYPQCQCLVAAHMKADDNTWGRMLALPTVGVDILRARDYGGDAAELTGFGVRGDGQAKIWAYLTVGYDSHMGLKFHIPKIDVANLRVWGERPAGRIWRKEKALPVLPITSAQVGKLGPFAHQGTWLRYAMPDDPAMGFRLAPPVIDGNRLSAEVVINTTDSLRWWDATDYWKYGPDKRRYIVNPRQEKLPAETRLVENSARERDALTDYAWYLSLVVDQ